MIFNVQFLFLNKFVSKLELETCLSDSKIYEMHIMFVLATLSYFSQQTLNFEKLNFSLIYSQLNKIYDITDPEEASVTQNKIPLLFILPLVNKELSLSLSLLIEKPLL